MISLEKLEEIARLVRYYILYCTTCVGSGHPTSALSATDLMVALFFGKLRFDLKNPENPGNDRVIFSKGHVSPLIYSLYAVAGVLTEKDLATYRKFKSPLEGHPRPNFKYIEVATGSLGQGLSIGLGMALAMRSGAEVGLSTRAFSNASVLRRVRLGSDTLVFRQAQGSSSENAARGQTSLRLKTRGVLDTLDTFPKVYVLMGDSEVSEGSVWEAIELASYYELGNLVGMIDVNRLGQSGETMLGWDVESYKKRIESFGWNVHLVDGHDMRALVGLFNSLDGINGRPQMVVAKTTKGKGVSFLENKEGWHGKALGKEQFEEAVKELGEINKNIRGEIGKPRYQVSGKNFKKDRNPKTAAWNLKTDYKIGELIATRKAYGEAVTMLGKMDLNVVVLDAEVKNSTYAEIFREKFPERFWEMFIAEQNMVGAALGFSKRGKIPFVSTFAAFFTRSFDQIRMSAYSEANIKFVGSHAGVAIGEDGPSQMGLEDLAMFRSVFKSVVLCPGDAVSCFKLVGEAYKNEGVFYIRTNRPATPVIYKNSESFTIGGSKVLRQSNRDRLTIVACGVVLCEAIKAASELQDERINVRVIDAYSIKPIDEVTLKKAAREANNLIVTVEDHYFEGGLGDAVLNVFANSPSVKVYKLAVSKMPMSGKAEELLDYEGISEKSIFKKVKELLK